MEIKLNVDGAQLSDEVRDLLDSLTVKQKKDMALQLLKDCMHDSETRFSKRVGVEQAIEELEKASNGKVKYRLTQTEYHGTRLEYLEDGSTYWHAASDKQARFDKLTRYYAEPYHYFRETILKEMLDVGTAHVEEVVKSSDKIQEAINKAVAEIEDRIPEMVQNAMRQMFVNVLSQSMANSTMAFEGTKEQQNLLGEIQTKLTNSNIF